ncbi:MAG: phosphotransferase [Steroidobacteraceae bacterium]
MHMTTAQRFEQVKEIRRRELERQPVARDIKDLPVSYELISDEWLTQALCTKAPGARVVSHTLDKADEGTSNRRRIFLKYNEAGDRAGLPASVFCKATQGLESRLVLGLNRSTEGETIFYNQIRPVLDIEAPIGLFANVDTETLNSILIMKDMGGQVQFCDHKTPISLERARSQVELLAKLHGSFYGKPERQKLLQPYLSLKEWCDLTEEAFIWSDARMRGFQAGEAVIPPRLFRRADEVESATRRVLDGHTQLPTTLIHSDVHLKNWYVAANGRMGLSDWQICVKGCGVRDLAYAVSTSLTIENRRAWEMDLIKHYVECVAAEDATPLSFDQTVLLYRQQLLGGLAMWTSTLTPAPGSPDMQPAETSLEFIKRMTHAIDDLDALGSF